MGCRRFGGLWLLTIPYVLPPLMFAPSLEIRCLPMICVLVSLLLTVRGCARAGGRPSLATIGFGPSGHRERQALQNARRGHSHPRPSGAREFVRPPCDHLL